MTVAELLELKANGGGLQLYLPAKFATDSSSHSLGADDQYITHCLPGGGFVVLPLERLLDYPIRIRQPPPGTFRRVLDDDSADFSRVPFTRTDVRDFRRRRDSDHDDHEQPRLTTQTDTATRTQTTPHD